MGELFDLMSIKWLANLESGARPMGAEMAMGGGKDGRGMECLTSSGWFLNRASSQSTDLVLWPVAVKMATGKEGWKLMER